MVRWRLFGANAVVAVVMSVSAGAEADFLDGKKLYDNCRSSNPSDRMFCDGYIAGLTNASRGPEALRKACPSPGTKLGQTIDVVLQYLAVAAAYQQFPAASLANSALATAFPCQ
jgi:hypothetical protein